jgi:hypothetical protein
MIKGLFETHLYVEDPDGHSLEFIGMLPGKSSPEKEKLVLSYEEWLETVKV